MNGSRAAFFRLIGASLSILVFGCGVYSLSGGGGLPGHIDSIAILPFDNQTTQFTLTQELTQSLSTEVPGRLGLKPADQSTANSVMRGTIMRYSERAVNYQATPGGPITYQRQVDITISVEIYDLVEDQVLWSSRSLTASGEYLPDSQTEVVGREIAIENLVQAIIDGAQSQW
jgi:hypothetical protein